uniref:Disease resistance protein winged helix domain-containing protein n=1 Tax=Fagus sylvatica TaxID=28930 RepID=A0A2N9J744_FAGSY
MEKLGREMVVRCAGLPLAIIVIGGLLATKETLDEWDIVHRNIKSHLDRGREQGQQSIVHEVLALSYHELPYQLKPCFLYLSHFLEDFDIPAKKLVRLWVVEGFVSPKYELEGDEMLEDFAERCLVELINRCMVQVGITGSSGRIKSCRLHDLMRDLCLSKAKQENFLHIVSPWSRNEKAHSSTVDVGQVVQGCPRLHKLHIEGQINKLPDYQEFPPYLTKLTLWGFRLEKDPMPVLEKLPNLRVLKGWGTFIGKQMEWIVEAGAMPSLFCLEISDCNKMVTAPHGLKFVSMLQELEIRWMPRAFKHRLEEGGEDLCIVQHVPSIIFLN